MEVYGIREPSHQGHTQLGQRSVPIEKTAFRQTQSLAPGGRGRMTCNAEPSRPVQKSEARDGRRSFADDAPRQGHASGVGRGGHALESHVVLTRVRRLARLCRRLHLTPHVASLDAYDTVRPASPAPRTPHAHLSPRTRSSTRPLRARAKSKLLLQTQGRVRQGRRVEKSRTIPQKRHARLHCGESWRACAT